MKVDRSLGLLGVLLEPTTVVAKAWEQVRVVGQRAFWEPRTVLVTGAGPIGLLAALVGRQHGLEVHVLDRVESGAKPELVRALGATYHTGALDGCRLRARRHHRVHRRRPGHRRLRSRRVAAGGVVCLTGVGSGGRTTGFRPPTSPRRWCSRTTSSSAASTRTSGTGTRRRRCWRARTARGSRGSSRGVSPRHEFMRALRGSRTTSRSSSSSRKPDRGERLDKFVSRWLRSNIDVVTARRDAIAATPPNWLCD